MGVLRHARSSEIGHQAFSKCVVQRKACQEAFTPIRQIELQNHIGVAVAKLLVVVLIKEYTISVLQIHHHKKNNRQCRICIEFMDGPKQGMIQRSKSFTTQISSQIHDQLQNPQIPRCSLRTTSRLELKRRHLTTLLLMPFGSFFYMAMP